jgi:hypothetical protein
MSGREQTGIVSTMRWAVGLLLALSACGDNLRGGNDASSEPGVYAAAATGFAGAPCFDGIRYSTPELSQPYVLACTDANGVFKTTLDSPLTWTNVDTGGITNPIGRAVATNPNGPPVMFISDASTTSNAFRSNTGGDTWMAESISDSGTPRDLFAFVFQQQIGNLAGSWDSSLGAIVLHGSTTTVTPAFVGASAGSVTGTVRAIASGGPKDIYVAVYGQTPTGGAASGGIYRACDLTSTGGGTYLERDTGIAASDLDLIWSLTADPASIVTTPFMCGPSTSSGSATTYYAALRGGGQIYKTTDGGVRWNRSNAGLPSGAEVYAIAIDCFSGTTCQNHTLVYAATSVGLYKSTDAGAHWTLDGFDGNTVRAVALHPTASPPQLLVGVDDAVGMYKSN